MNQTASEYLNAEYGEAQRTIQLEFDWMESVLLGGPAEVYCEVCGIHYDEEDPCTQH